MNPVGLCGFLGIVGLAVAGRGGTEPAPLPRPDALGETAVMSTNRMVSTPFSLERDPFWPVGFKPGNAEFSPIASSSAPNAPKPSPEETVDWPELHLRGVMQSGRGRMALLDEIGLVHEGDTVSRNVGALLFEWKILEITRDNLRYERLGYRRLEKEE